MNTFIRAGSGPRCHFALEDFLQREVEVPLDRGHVLLPLETYAIASVVLKDGLVVVHETIIKSNFLEGQSELVRPSSKWS